MLLLGQLSLAYSTMLKTTSALLSTHLFFSLSFSSTNLSCTSENALVTFNGLSSRSVEFNLPLLEILSSKKYSLPALPTITPHLANRQLPRRQNAVTSDGIIYEALCNF